MEGFTDQPHTGTNPGQQYPFSADHPPSMRLNWYFSIASYYRQYSANFILSLQILEPLVWYSFLLEALTRFSNYSFFLSMWKNPFNVISKLFPFESIMCLKYAKEKSPPKNYAQSFHPKRNCLLNIAFNIGLKLPFNQHMETFIVIMGTPDGQHTRPKSLTTNTPCLNPLTGYPRAQQPPPPRRQTNTIPKSETATLP